MRARRMVDRGKVDWAALPELYVPFPSAIHRCADSVDESTAAWLRGLQILAGEETYRRFHDTRIGRLAARFHPAAPLDRNVLDQLRALRRQGGGHVVEGLMETFFEETAAHLGTLRESARRGDPEGLKRGAHALAGICLSVGARRMAGICSELERAESVDAAQARGVLNCLEEEFGRTRTLLDGELSRS
jgi:HPt (histidine-containing phosphotransfer) domain-containing protein